MGKVIGIGETVLDIIFRNDRPDTATPGGSTFNSMISLGRTAGRDFPEVPVMMITETGDDHIGDIVVSFMESNGVSTKAVTRNPGTQTHISLAFLNERNDADYEFYKDHQNASLQEDKLLDIHFSSSDIVLFGSFFAVNPKIRRHTKTLLEEAAGKGATLYYDINFRKSHIKDIPDVLPNIMENCKLSSFVRGSSEDFGYLFGTTDPEEIYAAHISKLCRDFICTSGAGPVHVFTPGLHKIYRIPEMETVSTIGAGDSFNAGFIYGLISEGLSTGESRELTEEQWDKLIDTALKFSANVCASIYNYVDALQIFQ